MTGAVPTAWSAFRLAEFLAALTECPDEQTAARIAAERAAAAFDAEVALIVHRGTTVGRVGFAVDDAPPPTIHEIATGQNGTLTVPGHGPCPMILASHGDIPTGYHIALARRGDDFTPEERGLARSMTHVLALALRSLRLLARHRDREAMLERLAAVQGSIARRADLDDVLDTITAGLSELTGDEIAYIRIVDAQNPEVHHLASSSGVPRDMLPQIRSLPLSASVCGRAITENRLITRLDYSESVEAAGALSELGVTAVMAAPIRSEGKAIGALGVGSRIPGREYNDLERSVLLSFTEHASIALSNAHAVDGMRRALYDPLTGLPNRAFFTDQLDRALADDTMVGHVAVLFVDLDRFKSINDSLGHAAGDDLLCQVASRLTEAVRPGDIVARLGGDEFTILLTDVADLADARRVATRILHDLEPQFRIAGREIVVTASIGIAASGHDGSIDDLVQSADIAMYHAKQSGRSRFATFSPRLEQAAQQRLELEVDLRAALGSGALSVKYQPLVTVDTHTIVAAEALLRWERPNGGAVNIPELISVAEETGLIVPLGAWVLTEACARLAEWSPIAPDFKLHVNISGCQLAEKGFAEQVQEAIAQTKIAADRLTLEITESVLIGGQANAQTVVRELRGLGVELSLDDFGQGYSSLAYLADLDIQSIKIDRSFVERLPDSAASSTIVRHLISLAHELGMSVVAEGVERQDQAALLADFDCDTAQGFLFSPAVTADEISAALAGGGRPMCSVFVSSLG